MKIDSLVKNLEKNTAEQDKTMQEQAQSVTKQHLESYIELLKSSNRATKQALIENINLVKESKTPLQQALAWKTMLGALMGALATVFVILIVLNVWTGVSLKNKRAELAEITAKIEQSPLEAKALAQVEIVEENGIIYIASKEGATASNYSNDKRHILKLGK